MRTSISIFALILLLASCKKNNEIIEPIVIDETNLTDDLTTRGFVYTSNQTKNFEVWKYENETHTQLTNDPNFDCWWPRVSRTTGHILYYRSTSGREVNDYSAANLWVMDSLGNDQHMIIESGAYNWSQQGFADWSHDATQIVMSALDNEIGTWQIYITDADGQNPVRISKRDEVNFYDPVFNVDDATVICVTIPKGEPNNEANNEIIRLSTDGNGLEERLTKNDHKDHHPHVSPDGNRIVYESLLDPDYLSIGKWSLVQLDLTTAAESPLLDDDNINLFPRYSVDGNSVYYGRLNIETFAMTAASMHIRNGMTKTLVNDGNTSMNVDPF